MMRPTRLVALALVGVLAACTGDADDDAATDATSPSASDTTGTSVLEGEAAATAPALEREAATPEAPALDRQTMAAVPPLQHSDSTAESTLTRDSIEILSDLEAEQVETGTLVTLPDTVLFDFDEATLKPSAREVLDDLVAVLEEVDPAPVVVDGHTDGVGSDDYNQDLSERRAQAVATYFADAGIAADRLTSAGHGETQPLVEETDADGNDDPGARARNRRVEITIEGVSPDG